MRFIQVGVGGFGAGWVRWLTEAKGVQLVGLVDLNKEALAKACATAGHDTSICHASLKQALEAVEADAVVCVTPPEHHRTVAVEAMRAGLDVITEKPMADTMANCKAMLRVAEQTGQTCVVSQNYRYSPAPWTMADLVQRDKIGDVGQAKVEFYMGVDFRGGFRHVMDYPLLVDMSIHHFDLIRFITGLNPVSVSGTAWNPPWSNYSGDCSNTIVFEMSNGARIVYTASWCAKGQFCDWNGNWQIEGDKGTVVYRDNTVSLLDVPERYTVKRSAPVKMKAPAKGGQLFVLNDYLAAKRKGLRPRTDVQDNIHSIAMVFAAVKAVKTGRKVPILAG